MDLGGLEEAYHQFTTTVGLITTNGPRGPNVMAAEWTFNVSYRPFLIAVCVSPNDATHDIIDECREFGVNLASQAQIDLVALAGHFSKQNTDKLTCARFETYPGTVIGAPMIKGSLLNAECRLVNRVDLGDHTLFVGEVVAFSVDGSKDPLVYHLGSRTLGPRIPRRPAILVAGTPSEAEAGGTLRIDGEYMGAERREVPVRVDLVDSTGRTIAQDTVQADARGRFTLKMGIPADIRGGGYRVLASHDDIQGMAHISVGGPSP